jgi:hypothetical protein
MPCIFNYSQILFIFHGPSARFHAMASPISFPQLSYFFVATTDRIVKLQVIHIVHSI